ncbi:hypothetical protein CISG_04510 [Coccidioides immitis RMSCC 3703]|uniref:Uncharacterized protein n=1 Tax=Coccidioides immitis RMSCC 3703 TaxID=454286 RepID=A0A0J8QPI8_COCIT|nr:hypothetical protein CISG_04510 [Coccidioides immitis RMSCC 3703]
MPGWCQFGSYTIDDAKNINSSAGATDLPDGPDKTTRRPSRSLQGMVEFKMRYRPPVRSMYGNNGLDGTRAAEISKKVGACYAVAGTKKPQKWLNGANPSRRRVISDNIVFCLGSVAGGSKE